jgi:hypothetical protein
MPENYFYTKYFLGWIINLTGMHCKGNIGDFPDLHLKEDLGCHFVHYLRPFMQKLGSTTNLDIFIK